MVSVQGILTVSFVIFIVINKAMDSQSEAKV